MKFLSILVLCILSCNGISGMVNKRTTAFKSVKKCAKEHDLDFTVITKFFKGDFSVDTKNVRCFLKCVANDLEFWIDEKPQKSNIMNYVDILVKNTEGTDDIIEKCIDNDVSDDFCDHLYNVFKCFWQQAMDKQSQKTVVDDFHFNENELVKDSTDSTTSVQP